MCVKFQLSVSESSRGIKGIVLPAGSVHLQAREWQFDPDSASQRKLPLLPPTAAIRYSMVVTVCAQCSECQREEIQKARANGGRNYDSLNR